MNTGSDPKHELRLTETNSADDSAGKTWGAGGQRLLVRRRRGGRGGAHAPADFDARSRTSFTKSAEGL